MKYDLANWLKHPKEAIFHTARSNTFIELKQVYQASELFIRWTRPNYRDAVIGLIEAELISPLGRPPRQIQQFEVSTDQQHYVTWPVLNDGLPFKLHARLLQNPQITTYLEVWEYIPPTFTTFPMGSLNNPAAADLTPIINAINASSLQDSNMTAGIQQMLNQIAINGAPLANSKFVEKTISPWNANSNNSVIFSPDPLRRLVEISYPAKNAQGARNTATLYFSTGLDPRDKISGYDYALQPGGSLELPDDEAVKQICCWRDVTPNVADPLINFNVFTR